MIRFEIKGRSDDGLVEGNAYLATCRELGKGYFILTFSGEENARINGYDPVRLYDIDMVRAQKVCRDGSTPEVLELRLNESAEVIFDRCFMQHEFICREEERLSWTGRRGR